MKNIDRNQENSVKLITLAQRYANVVKRWEGSIYELLMTIVFVEAWRKRGFGVLLFWNWNRNFLHVDIGLHIKRTTVIGWETKGPTHAWAIVLKTIKQLTTSWCQPIKNHKNIATYIILARHQKIGEYIYTQLNIFFRGNFFLAVQCKRPRNSLREDRSSERSILPWILPILGKGFNTILKVIISESDLNSNRFSLPSKLDSRLKLQATSCWLAKRAFKDHCLSFW